MAPDASLDDLLTLLEDLPDTALACTHREAFEKLLGWDVTCEKGGAWVLERSGSELVPALYLAPPSTVGAGQRQAVWLHPRSQLRLQEGTTRPHAGGPRSVRSVADDDKGDSC